MVPFWLQVMVAGASLLSAGTAFIAALSSERSRARASEAQETAIKAWQESAAALKAANALAESQHAERMATDARGRRAAYGVELSKLSSVVLSAAMLGMPEQEILKKVVEISDEMLPAQFASDEPSAAKIGRWITTYGRTLQPRDINGWSMISSLIATRVKLWVNDPVAAMAAIRADPEIPGLSPVNLDDAGDFRVP